MQDRNRKYYPRMISDTAIAMAVMENRLRDQANMENARILGYDLALQSTQGLELTPARNRREELVEEVEDNRYFVVLLAYDFQLMWKQKKPKLFWEARFSISERGNEFDKQLALMALYASRFFGQDSHGLRNRPS